MVERRDYALSNRGGIPLRDFTLGGRSLPQSIAESRGGPKLLRKINFNQVARALVWVSLGLGLAEVLAPKRIQKLVGVRRGKHEALIRFAGFREIGHALMLITQARPQQAVISRVIGDVLDLGLLGAAFTTPRVKKNRLAIALASISGITLLDALTATQLKSTRAAERRSSLLTQADLEGRRPGGGFHVSRSITINRSPQELYTFWRDFSRLPQFMYHLQEVRVIDDRRSHWKTSAPAGMQVEWDAQIIEDRPNELIAWRAINNAEVPNSGMVRFEPLPNHRGTVVHVEIDYDPPGGQLGRLVAKLFGEEPRQQIKGDLQRFKQVIETGEVMRSDGSPQGMGQKLQPPARPAGTFEPEFKNKKAEKYRERDAEIQRERERKTTEEW
jgi:uncharacterized membrane protein